MSISDELTITGTPIAQVFTIRVKDITDAEKKYEVYGNIHVQDEAGILNLYNKGPESCEPINRDGSISLAGQDRPIYAYSGFRIILDLKDKNGNEFINNSFSVDLLDESRPPDTILNKMFDNCLVYDVKGTMADATVYLTVLRVGVFSRITAFVRTDGEAGDVLVSGTLTARYGKRFKYCEGVKEYCRMVLFEKKVEEAVHLLKDKNGNFLISRFHLSAPAYANMVIEAEFDCQYDDGRKEKFGPCVQEISPEEIGLKTVEVKGNHGCLLVRVMFNGACYPYFSSRRVAI